LDLDQFVTVLRYINFRSHNHHKEKYLPHFPHKNLLYSPKGKVHTLKCNQERAKEIACWFRTAGSNSFLFLKGGGGTLTFA